MKLQSLFDLHGKAALVTGGGRGLGKSIATALAEAGADLVLASRKLKNLAAAADEIEKSCGTRVLPVACDVAKEEEVDALLEGAMKTFGGIHVLVNNAGAAWGAPTLEFPLERWDYLFNVNVRGVWMLTQKVARVMKEQGGGNIVNISSVWASRGSEEALHPSVPYNSTKAAINLLTMNLAVKLAPYKIRVNAIAPGYFRTDMMAYMDKPESRGVYEQLIRMIPMGRMGEVEDIRGAAVFLASEASAYLTGHVLVIDGGLLAR
ncbi:MAG: glucose 1-dehydrogenase [bacterium]